MLLAGEWVPRWTQVHIPRRDRKSTRLNSSHSQISYAVFCLKKKTTSGSLSQESTAFPKQNRRRYSHSYHKSEQTWQLIRVPCGCKLRRRWLSGGTDVSCQEE